MNKPAAIYARVSSDRQKENHTIASQTAALIEYAQKNGYSVPPEWVSARGVWGDQLVRSIPSRATSETAQPAALSSAGRGELLRTSQASWLGVLISSRPRNCLCM